MLPGWGPAKPEAQQARPAGPTPLWATDRRGSLIASAEHGVGRMRKGKPSGEGGRKATELQELAGLPNEMWRSLSCSRMEEQWGRGSAERQFINVWACGRGSGRAPPWSWRWRHPPSDWRPPCPLRRLVL